MVEYEFEIRHLPLAKNAVADYLLQSIGEWANKDVTVHLDISRLLAERTTQESNMVGLVLNVAEMQAGHVDQYEGYLEEVSSYLESLRRVPVPVRVRRRAENYPVIQGLWIRRMKKGLRVVSKIPERPNIMQSMHDAIGHWKAQKTNFFISSQFWWPTIQRDIRGYVQSCKACQLSRASSTSIILGIQTVVGPFHTI